MDLKDDEKIYPFSGAFKEVSDMQGFCIVPSVSSMVHHVERYTKQHPALPQYKVTVAHHDEKINLWLRLPKASPEEHRTFVSEYKQREGTFEFDETEFRKADFPDSKHWSEWMEATMEALWVLLRSPHWP